MNEESDRFIPIKAGATNSAEIAERGRTARGRFASPGIGLMVRGRRQQTAIMPVRIVRLEDRVDAAGGRIFLGSPRHAGHQSARRTPVTATKAGTTSGRVLPPRAARRISRTTRNGGHSSTAQEWVPGTRAVVGRVGRQVRRRGGRLGKILSRRRIAELRRRYSTNHSAP